MNTLDILFILNYLGVGAVPAAAFVFKVVVIQWFGRPVRIVFKNGAVLVSGHARFGAVHAGPYAARSSRAGVLAHFTALRFQLGGFA